MPMVPLSRPVASQRACARTHGRLDQPSAFRVLTSYLCHSDVKSLGHDCTWGTLIATHLTASVSECCQVPGRTKYATTVTEILTTGTVLCNPGSQERMGQRGREG